MPPPPTLTFWPWKWCPWDVGYLCANFSLPRLFSSYARCMRQTDITSAVRQTDVRRAWSLNAPTIGAGHNKDVVNQAVFDWRQWPVSCLASRLRAARPVCVDRRIWKSSLRARCDILLVLSPTNPVRVTCALATWLPPANQPSAPLTVWSSESHSVVLVTARCC